MYKKSMCLFWAALLAIMPACSVLTAPLTATSTATVIEPSATVLPTRTAAPTRTPTPTPVPPILTDGNDSWVLISIMYKDYVETGSFGPGGGPIYPTTGFTFLQADFDCATGSNLLSAWSGTDLSGITQIYLVNGIADIYLTAQGQDEKFPAVILGECSIVFPVPEDAAGFALHFKDLPVVELTSPTATVVITPTTPTITKPPVEISAYCAIFGDSPAYVEAGAPVILTWGWSATSAEYRKDYIDAASFSLRIDNKVIDLSGTSQNLSKEGGVFNVGWKTPPLSLEAGEHKAVMTITLNREIKDGFDSDNNGVLDTFGPSTETIPACEIIVEAPAAACANGAPAGHWALIVNKTGSGSGTIMIDGKAEPIKSGKNAIYLTAGKTHTVLVGTNTLNFNAPECGENTVSVP